MAKQPVSGSDKLHPEGATCVGACNPAEEIEVVVMLRRQDENGFRQLMAKIDAGEGTPVPRDEFEKRFGASQEDVAKVEKFAAQYGLTVVRADPGSRSVVLKGTIEAVPEGLRRHARTVPASQHRRVSRSHGAGQRARRHARRGHRRARSRQPSAGASAFSLPAAVQAGARSRAGVVHAARTSRASTTSLKATAAASASASSNSAAAIARATSSAYFSSLGVKAPKVVAIGVDRGEATQPTGNPNGPDGEVTLDIEIVGRDRARRDARGVLHAEQRRRFHRCREPRDPRHDATSRRSISISWGGPESMWTGAVDAGVQRVCCKPPRRSA